MLRNPEVEVEKMMAWTRELFLGKGAEKLTIPEDILKFGFELMSKNFEKAENRSIKNMILRKILHTKEVVEAGFEIMENENGVDWNPYMVGAVTFAHDFGRFPQAHLGSYSDIKTGFDHAEAGAEFVLKGSFPESEKRGLDIQGLAEAVRAHSQLEYNGNDIYGMLIRDADKTGLLNYFHYHIKEYEVFEGKVSPGAVKAVLNGKLVLKLDIRSKIDVFLTWLSWQYDLNFPATKKLFEASGVKQYIFDEIKKRDETVWEKVREL